MTVVNGRDLGKPVTVRSMSRVVFPGSFDPLTMGHLDICRRIAPLWDEVIICVVANPNKQGLFTIDERVAMIDEEVKNLPNVSVDHWSGLLTDYCQSVGASAIIKGLRSASDFDYETPMASMNHHLAGIETIYLSTSPQYAFISSSLCKEVAKLGGNIDGLLPPRIITQVLHQLSLS